MSRFTRFIVYLIDLSLFSLLLNGVLRLAYPDAYSDFGSRPFIFADADEMYYRTGGVWLVLILMYAAYWYLADRNGSYASVRGRLIVDEKTGELATEKQQMKRALGKAFTALALPILLIAPFVRDDKRGIYDLVAGTQVVKA